MVCRFGVRIPEGDQGDVGERVARGTVADGQRGAESHWASASHLLGRFQMVAQ